MNLVIPTITEEMFAAYETVRASGITNMFDLPVVCDHSGLSREEARTIMKNYRALTQQYPNVRKQ
jgi:DNA-directed RNA polymerase subunit H (RpoH/RPB5)